MGAAISETGHNEERPLRLTGVTRRNVAALGAAQAILGAQLPAHITIGPLAAASLAPSAAWATAPVTMMILANFFSAALVSQIHRALGRRLGLLSGALAGFLGGALCLAGLALRSFELLLAGSALFGVFQANLTLFRFAATDTAEDRLKPIAMSWVMLFGVFAGVTAPALIYGAQDALAPLPLAGVYAGVMLVNLVGCLPLLLLQIPKLPRRVGAGASGRPMREILAVPDVRVAILCGMVAFSLMVMVMTTTSTAMVACGFSEGTAGAVIGLHVVGMYLPSLITGRLIARFGPRPVITAGLLLLGSCALIASAGVSLTHFSAALFMLGVGWNFAYIGASSWLTQLHAPEERAKVQGLNETLIFGLVAAASLCGGAINAFFGWAAVNLAMAPLILVAGAALLLTARPRRAPGAAA